jgi:hypothetical protein
MSVVYRALWEVRQVPDRDAYLDEVLNRFSRWAQNSPNSASLSEGTTELRLHDGGARTVEIRRVQTGLGLEASAQDNDAGETETWSTLLRAVDDNGVIRVLIENGVESSNLAGRVKVGRPRFVNDLLKLGKPTLGSLDMPRKVINMSAKDVDTLERLLATPRRELPVVLCSQGDASDSSFKAIANRVAERVAGIAWVVTVDHAAADQFHERMGDLAVWNGASRIYVPVPDGDWSQAWRHRYFLRPREQGRLAGVIDSIVYSVAQLSTRRQVPRAFRVFSDAAGLVQEEDVLQAWEELEHAKTQAEDALAKEIADASEVEKELSRATGHLRRLKDALIESGQADLFFNLQYPSGGRAGTELPDEVQDTSEAVLFAQEFLSEWLSVPDSAARELDDIDTAPNAFAWGNTTWRGLQALAQYARDRRDGRWARGGFWEWCEAGGPLAWPATPKKLSMKESEGVQNNQRLRDKRSFSVDPAVDPRGQVVMWAHMKISEGGGDLAPRIYFHDDTAGTTKKVHVGFVGPHRLVPNLQA